MSKKCDPTPPLSHPPANCLLTFIIQTRPQDLHSACSLSAIATRVVVGLVVLLTKCNYTIFFCQFVNE